jgi:dTDP-4-dehydrorhamnose reductase
LSTPRILITGASGQLGGYLLRELAGKPDIIAWSGTRGGDLFGFPLCPVDLADPEGVAMAFRAARPDAVLHLAALSAVSACHADPTRAERTNVHGTNLLAELAAERGARLVYVSTDMVFDGMKGNYCERDEPNPLMTYSRTKLAAEPAVLAAPRAAVARVSLLFGPTVIGRPYFFDLQLDKLRAGQKTTWFEDEWRSPLALVAAARALLDMLRSDFTGLIHVGGPERLSRLDFGLRLGRFFGADPINIVPVTQASVSTPEPRPRDLSLDLFKWVSLFPSAWRPSWEEAMASMFEGSAP